MTHTTGVLTVADVSHALVLNELEVCRLIARKRLPATVVKTSLGGETNIMHIRVLATELQKFVAGGARDSAPPSFSNNWFSDPEYAIATITAEAMRSAATAQFKSDDQVRAEYETALSKTKRLYSDLNAAQRPEVLLRLTPEIAKAANQPIASFTNKWLSEKYSKSVEALLVSRIRGFARIAMGSHASVARLYSSAAEYAEVTTAAMELMAAAPLLSVSRTTKIITGPDAGSDITVSYRLPFKAFDLSGTIEAAF